MLVAHVEARSLVNKFVIHLLEARRYILDQDCTSVQRLWVEFGFNPVSFCCKMAEKQTLLSVHSGHFLVTNVECKYVTSR